MASLEPDVETRLQLAATARRVDAATGLQIVFRLLQRDEDAADPYLPNMLWWALESHADHVADVVAHLTAPDAWASSIRVADASLVQNLMRRYAMAGKQADLEACGMLLQAAPSADERQQLVAAFSKAYMGRPLPPLPTQLADLLGRERGPFALLLAVRQQQADGIERALSRASDSTIPLDERIEWVRALYQQSLEMWAERDAPLSPLMDGLRSAGLTFASAIDSVYRTYAHVVGTTTETKDWKRADALHGLADISFHELRWKDLAWFRAFRAARVHHYRLASGALAVATDEPTNLPRRVSA